MQSFSSVAQIEYFVEINESTGDFTIINDIPNVNFIQTGPVNTSFDENAGHYIFKGTNFDETEYLYSIDAISGDIVYNPSYPVFANALDNLAAFQMDRNNSILYGLHWNNADQTEYFVTVDRINGTFNIISELPGVNFVALLPDYKAFNEDLNYFTFGGTDANSNNFIYTVDASTGTIIASPPFPTLDNLDNIQSLQYDRVNQTYYALYWDNSEQTEYLISFDPINATFNILYPIPGVQYISSLPNYTSFNESEGHYIFRGGTQEQLLFSVNVNTGAVVYNPIFPVLNNPMDNVIELMYDNIGNKLYGLHWSNTVQPQIAAADDEFTVQGECLAFTISVIDNDELQNADEIAITITNNPDNGTATVDESTNEILIMIDDINMVLPVFTYEICVENGFCDEAEISFMELACPSPEPPLEIMGEVLQGQILELNIDASQIPSEIVTTSFDGSLTVINDSIIHYQSATDFIGTDSWISQEIFVSECCGTWPTGGISIFIEVLNDTSLVSISTTEINQFEIGPNPFLNEIEIKNIIESDYKIQLYDLIGRLVAESNSEFKLTNLDHLLPAIYLLKIEIGDDTYFKKLVKQ